MLRQLCNDASNPILIENKSDSGMGLQPIFKTFKGFVFSWLQAINFVHEYLNPLKVFKTVVMFSMN